MIKSSVMLDIETIGVTEDAVVLTVGAVKFDPHSSVDPHSPFYIKIDVNEQTAKGRIVDPGTMDWWSKQTKESQEEAFDENDRVSMDEFTKQLSKYLVGSDKIYAQGPLFDIVILSHLYKSLKKAEPWNYYQIRDSRTIFDMGDDSAKKNNKLAHNALADAYQQAVSVQSIFKELKVKRKS